LVEMEMVMGGKIGSYPPRPSAVDLRRRAPAKLCGVDSVFRRRASTIQTEKRDSNPLPGIADVGCCPGFPVAVPVFRALCSAEAVTERSAPKCHRRRRQAPHGEGASPVARLHRGVPEGPLTPRPRRQTSARWSRSRRRGSAASCGPRPHNRPQPHSGLLPRCRCGVSWLTVQVESRRLRM
jgi:hypothetical protein